jgi:hypothetical protein
MELDHLLLGDVDLVELGRDLLDVEKAALSSLVDQRAKLVDLGDRRLVGEQLVRLGGGQSAPSSTSICGRPPERKCRPSKRSE